MNQNNEEKLRLEGYYRRDDYTIKRYGNVAMRNYSKLRIKKINNIIKTHFGANSTISLIDIGCGTGVVLKQLRALNETYNLTGLDFSPDMLENTVINSNENIELLQGSAFEVPQKNNSFDVVITTRFIHQYTDDLKIQLLEEMQRLVKDDGIIIVEFYSYFSGLIRYIVESIIMPSKFESDELKKDFFKHYIGKNQLDSLSNMKYEIEPVVLPWHSKFTNILGPRLFLKFNNVVQNLGIKFSFSEYLAVFKPK